MCRVGIRVSILEHGRKRVVAANGRGGRAEIGECRHPVVGECRALPFFRLIAVEGKVIPGFLRIDERFVLADQTLPDIGWAAVEFGNFVDDRFAIAGHFAQVEGTTVKGKEIDRLDHLDLSRKPGGVRRTIAPHHAHALHVECFGIGRAVFIEPVFGNCLRFE